MDYHLTFKIHHLSKSKFRMETSGRNFALKYARFSILLLALVCCLSSAISAQKERSISEVQSDKNISPFAGQPAQLTGIVTARIRDGFFIQTPDDKTDGNPATSEGIYVFTGNNQVPAEAVTGNLVTVTGTISEYRPKAEPKSLPITELSMKRGADTIKVVSKDNALPKPITLIITDFKPNKIDQLEKYEGMRVLIENLLVVGPTKGRVNAKTGVAASDGVFYGVLKGIPRPFREPGLDFYDVAFMSDKEKAQMKKDFPKIPIFDSNPEILRVDSDAQIGEQKIADENGKEDQSKAQMVLRAQVMNVTAEAEIGNLVGVMHYGFQKYTILPDADGKPTISKLKISKPLPQTNDRQFSLAGMNLENFFDDEDDPKIKEDVVTTEAFNNRIKKMSMAIRDYLHFPDVIGAIEVENLNALKKLAEKINSDAVADKQANPKYEAYLVEGNDARGIDVGFLVKSSRVKFLAVAQIGKDEQFKDSDGKNDNLFDRPPLVLQAAIEDAQTGKPFAFAVVVNHLKSFLGVDDPKDGGARVRLKRELQAEFLAKMVNERQKQNPNEPLVLLGDFNAFQFNDGIGDIIGVIKGTPAPKDQVLTASEDLVNPDLIDLVDLIKSDQRYSFSYDGNAQDIDHIIVTQTMKKHLAAFGFARFNADFPEVYRNDPTRVERFSDHDAAIGYFNLDETATPVPQATSN